MQTVLITGATSGFGYATAKLLSQNGFKLILTGRRKERLLSIRSEINTPLHIANFDIQKKEEVDKFFKELPEEFKDIDILINNAGLALGLDTAQNSQISDWETMVNTNIMGLLYMTRQSLEIMEHNDRGLIINIGSVAGEVPYKGGNVYGATKAFVKQFSKNLRADLFGTNIKVTNIAPGAAETEFSEVRFKGDKDKAKQVYQNTRALTAEDIAQTILWVVERPPHVNIDNIDIMPIDQSYAGLNMFRKN